MFKRFVSVLTLALGVLPWSATSSWSQEQTTISITPRLWYSFISPAHAYPGRGMVVDNAAVPLFGASFTVVPAGLGGATVSLTALYGTGSGDYQATDACCVYSGTNDRQRLDVDGQVLFPIGTAGAYWSVGMRYFGTNAEAAGFDQFAAPFKFTTSQKFLLQEVGVGAQAPLNANGTQRFFGGLTFVVGQKETETRDLSSAGFNGTSLARQTVAGVDAAIGYAANLTASTMLYARYRLLVVSDIEDFGASDARDIVHGPELNISIKLN